MAVQSWLMSSMVRVFPHASPGAPGFLTVDVARNERCSFQLGLRAEGTGLLRVRVQVDAPSGLTAQVKRVGFVPVAHHNTPQQGDDADLDGRRQIPGFVPDPLFEESEVVLPPGETHAFWVSVTVDAEATPGSHEVSVVVSPEGEAEQRHTAWVRVHDVCLEPRRGFAVTNWFYADALIDWYQTDLFDKRFWEVAARYVRDVVDHNQDTLYVPVFTPPLDGVKRPSQLLRVERIGDHRYRFDWQDVARYVALARNTGVSNFEWCHFFTQWGARNAIRVYQGQGRDEKLLWEPDTAATSDTYRLFLAQYLPELYRFLQVEGIVAQSFFHVSDEPHGESDLAAYREAREMLGELAPWMRVMDALTELDFAQQGLTDMPIPSIRTALDFVAAGVPSWCYYCCGPRGRYLNRLLDTPLSKIAMHGFLFYRWPFQGFLHWGYNYWYESQTRRMIDPYFVQDGLAWERGWAYGDPFMVYPGAGGPVDSMRWEVFSEALQDYALLQTLDVDRESELLAPIKSFEDFPKSELWRRNVRRSLLQRAASSSSAGSHREPRGDH
jgi:hypothetical protein